MKRNIVVACLLLAIAGCTEKNKDNFDRTAMLTNLGNNIIVPAYESLHAKVTDLKNKGDVFVVSPSAATLDSLKQAFVLAYTQFQAVEGYSFTASQDMRNALNSFPADTTQIKNNISAGTYDLSTVNNLKAKGFVALDYLLFSNSSPQTIDWFTTDVDAQKRKQYLADVLLEIHTKSAAAYNTWSSTYIGTFIAASGTDVGSSVGMLVNDLSFELERNRKDRVGNALGYIGLISGGVLLPASVEAYYSGYSKELLIENLQQLKKLYQGGSGNGFDDYLDYLKADYNGTPLSAEISNQFDKAILAAQNVPVAFSAAVTTHNAEMQSLFLELKRLTVLLKVDMSSQLGVVINYSDNDGD